MVKVTEIHSTLKSYKLALTALVLLGIVSTIYVTIDGREDGTRQLYYGGGNRKQKRAERKVARDKLRAARKAKRQAEKEKKKKAKADVPKISKNKAERKAARDKLRAERKARRQAEKEKKKKKKKKAKADVPKILPHDSPICGESWTSQCSASSALTFRASKTEGEGKTSTKDQISVSGGDWNKVHVELTCRTMNDGESFVITGNKQQVGVGLCIDSCDLESDFGIRWHYNCIGFYGDGTPMLATDENKKEYTVSVDRYRSNTQGFTYDQANNCVTHIGSYSKTCTPLPEHFKGKPVRAIGQVWNSASAKVR